MKHIFVLLLFLFFISCSSKNNEVNSVNNNKDLLQNDSVFIKFKLSKEETLNLRVSNIFLESQILDNFKNESTVKLFVGDELSYVYVFKDLTNNSGLYVKKGDSIEISYMDGKFMFNSLTSKKNTAELNLDRDYYEYVKKNKPFVKISLDKKTATNQKNIKEVLLCNEKLYQVRLNFVNQYKEEHKVEDTYVNSFLGQFKFTKLRLDYWDIKAIGSDRQLNEKYSEILNLFKKENIQAESLALLFEIIIDYSKTQIPTAQKNDKAFFAQYLFNSIKNDYSERNRDILILELIHKGKNVVLLNKFYNEFKSFSKNEIFLNRAKEIVRKNSERQSFAGNEDTLLKDPKGKTITLQELLTQQKGSAVYIDFWASWCAPCRLEMPKSLVASEKYKNIKFIYISTDENEGQWKKANIKMLPNYSNSYLLLNEKSSKFIQEINLSAIPRHIIFDKNGEISNNDAPGANDLQFDNILKQY